MQPSVGIRAGERDVCWPESRLTRFTIIMKTVFAIFVFIGVPFIGLIVLSIIWTLAIIDLFGM